MVVRRVKEARLLRVTRLVRLTIQPRSQGLFPARKRPWERGWLAKMARQ